MEYALIVFFSCGLGCGSPTQFTAQQRYQSFAQCDAAGRIWVSPSANPVGAIAGYRCMSGDGAVAQRDMKFHIREHLGQIKRLSD